MFNQEEENRIKALEELVSYLEDRLAALELIALSYPEKEVVR